MTFTQHAMRAAAWSGCLAVTLILAACSSHTPALVPSASPTTATQPVAPPSPAAAASPTLPAPSVQGLASATATVTDVVLIPVPELALLPPENEQPEGPATLRGLYGRYGADDRSLFACRRDQNALRCTRYALSLPTVGPILLEVDAQIEAGQVRAIAWRPVADDLTASQAAAQLALAAVADQVAALNWASLARADFAESSASARWPADSVRRAVPELFGYDMATNRVIWRVQGPDMPPQKALVTRFPALYLLTSLDGRGPVDVLATIEGYVVE